MPVESDADRLAFLSTDEFATTVVVLDQGSPEPTFVAIFDRPYEGVFAGEGPGLQSTQPMITARTSDVSGFAEGQRLLIDGTVYRFERDEPDGTGFSNVRLSVGS